LEVRIISRQLLAVPALDDPARKVYAVVYQVGELPPGFVYVPEKGYSKEKETAAIKKHFEDRQKIPTETTTI
jgi:hypothetical protein